MSSDLEMAQEVVDRVLRLLPKMTSPLRQLDPDEQGVRVFQVGDYSVKVERYVPKFFSLSGPHFGWTKGIWVQQHVPFTHFPSGGYPFFFNMDGADGPTWKAQLDRCSELLRFLRLEMVLDDMADDTAGYMDRANILSLREP